MRTLALVFFCHRYSLYSIHTIPEPQMRELMAPEPPLKISVISHTLIEALVESIDKAIPFGGFLNGWAYLGHSVAVFEGHLSALESGIRGSDVLIIDSGMMPFIRLDWRHVVEELWPRAGRS